MATNDPSLSRLRVSTTSSGTYTNVGYVRSVDLTRGSEGDTTLKWLGGEEAKAGDKTLSAAVPIYWIETDTLGQTVLNTAYDAQSTIWFQACPTGTATGAKVYQFSGVVTEAPFNFAADGDAVEGSYTIRGNPSSWSVVTLA